MPLLGSCPIVAFVTISNPDRARKFYRDTLGLRLAEESPFALVFEVNGVTLRVAIASKVTIAPYTVLGWQVKDIAAKVKALVKAGINLERFDGMGQDELGIWKSPSGAQVAWFKDPEGNLLSITQH